MKQIVQVEAREYVVEVETGPQGAVFRVDGEALDASVVSVDDGVYSVLLGGRSFEIRIEQTASQMHAHVVGLPYPLEVSVRDPRRRRTRGAIAAEGRQEIVSPMPGKVIRLLVEEGQRVKAGQGLMVVEAMKMQNEIKSPKDGVVTKIAARAGSPVNAGEPLLIVE